MIRKRAAAVKAAALRGRTQKTRTYIQYRKNTLWQEVSKQILMGARYDNVTIPRGPTAPTVILKTIIKCRTIALHFYTFT